MELGEVYKTDGNISYEKLFYYHFRKISNTQSFRAVEGNEIISEILNSHREKVKDIFEQKLFDNDSQKLIEIEKVLILFTEEIFVSNANNLEYYYSDKRLVSDERLTEFAREFRNY